MHTLNLPDVHATLDHIIIELTEESCSSELGAGEPSQWMGIETIDHYTQAEEHE